MWYDVGCSANGSRMWNGPIAVGLHETTEWIRFDLTIDEGPDTGAGWSWNVEMSCKSKLVSKQHAKSCGITFNDFADSNTFQHIRVFVIRLQRVRLLQDNFSLWDFLAIDLVAPRIAMLRLGAGQPQGRQNWHSLPVCAFKVPWFLPVSDSRHGTRTQASVRHRSDTIFSTQTTNQCSVWKSLTCVSNLANGRIKFWDGKKKDSVSQA